MMTHSVACRVGLGDGLGLGDGAAGVGDAAAEPTRWSPQVDVPVAICRTATAAKALAAQPAAASAARRQCRQDPAADSRHRQSPQPNSAVGTCCYIMHLGPCGW